MNVLGWDENFQQGTIISRRGHRPLVMKPDLSFEFDSLLYIPQDDIYSKEINGMELELTAEERIECEKHVNSFDFSVEKNVPNVFGIDEHGGFIGVGRPEDFVRHTQSSPAVGHHVYNSDKDAWDYIYGVDAEGNYIGNVPPQDCASFAKSAPPSQNARWVESKQKWEIIFDLDIERDIMLESLKTLCDITVENALGVSTLGELARNYAVLKENDEYIAEVNEFHKEAVDKLNKVEDVKELFTTYDDIMDEFEEIDYYDV